MGMVYYRSAKTGSCAIVDAIKKSGHSSIHLTISTDLSKIKLNEYEIIIVGVACNPETSCFLKIQTELDKLKNYKSFAVSRDPYSKFVSSINYCNLTDEKLLKLYNNKLELSIHDQVHITRTQTDSLSHGGHFFADKIIKFENFDEIFNFFKLLGIKVSSIPKKNVTKQKKLELDNQMIRYVNQKFLEDFKNFDYNMK